MKKIEKLRRQISKVSAKCLYYKQVILPKAEWDYQNNCGKNPTKVRCKKLKEYKKLKHIQALLWLELNMEKILENKHRSISNLEKIFNERGKTFGKLLKLG